MSAQPRRVCVIGLGKMGLPVAMQFASAGASVIGVDIDERVVAGVNAGMPPAVDEPGVAERLEMALHAGAIRATTDTRSAVGASDAVIVLVRAALDSQGRPDYSALDDATAEIAGGLRPGTLISYETSLPIGDTRGRFRPALESRTGLRAGEDFNLCFSPERVQAGRVLQDLRTYPKVVGGLTPGCAEAGRALYAAHLPAPVLVMSSLEAAELTKVAENLYRDVNIALANELARFADDRGVDLLEVIAAANSQPLSHLHRPGLGVGGHCIPVYAHFFIGHARDARMTTLARAVNDAMPAYGVDRLQGVLGDLRNRHVLVLGLAFRGGVREAAFSMAFPLVDALHRHGAQVRVHDPVFGPDGVRAHGLEWGAPEDGWAEAMVLQADHREYLELTPDDVPGVIVVLDGRGVLDPERWSGAGVRFVGVGR